MFRICEKELESLIGQKIGKLNVLSLNEEYDHHRYNVKCDCGIEFSIRREFLVDNNKDLRACRKCVYLRISKDKSIDLTGQRFGNLVVKEKLKHPTKKNMVWLCNCDCGKQSLVETGRLTSGTAIDCTTHKNICMIKETSLKWHGFGKIDRHKIREISENAKRRNIEYSQSPEKLWNLFLSQDCKCYFTGLDLKFIDSETNRETANASLDRLNPDFGYIEGNIAWVHKKINAIKYTCNENDFLQWVSLIILPYTSLDLPFEPPNYGKRSHKFTGCGNLSGHRWSQIRKWAIARDLSFEIDVKQAWDRYLEQKGRCAISGVEISLIPMRDSESTASLDRIDSNKGYTLDNIQWVHVVINHMKWDFSMKEFLNWCNMVYNYKILEKKNDSVCIN